MSTQAAVGTIPTFTIYDRMRKSREVSGMDQAALADTIGVIYNGELLKIADASTLTDLEVGKYMMGVKE